MKLLLPLLILHCSLFIGGAFASATELPTSGLTLHLAADSVETAADGKVAALLDTGPAKLRVPAYKKTGGGLSPSALNGHPAVAIQNNGFRVPSGKNAAKLNATADGFALVLVAKVSATKTPGDLVRKQGSSVATTTGWRVLLGADSSKGFQIWAAEDADNRSSYGIPPPQGWFVLIENADAQNSRLDAILNGQPLGGVFKKGGFASLSNNDHFLIGNLPDGVMEFAELALYNRPLTAAECESVSASLAAKYGIAAEKPLSANPADWLQNGFTHFDSTPSRPLEANPQKLPDGRLLTFSGPKLIASSDGGATWNESIDVFNADKLPPVFKGVPPEIVRLGVTSSGAWIVLALSPETRANSDRWEKETGQWHADLSGSVIHSTRSTDKGKTWTTPAPAFRPPQTITTHYPRDIVEAATGVLVFSAQHGLRNPTRNVVTMVRSTDDGVTWQPTATTFDLPETAGHHDGPIEPTLARLNDGGLLIFLRTNLGCFYQSRSDDGGLSWTPPAPTAIAASSSPGTFLRLPDKRLLLAYNPETASDNAVSEMRGGDKFFSARRASWQRREVAVITSRDDGKTWSAPLVVARDPRKRGAEQLAYLGLWEHGGFLHLTAGQGLVQARAPLDKLP